MIRKSTLIEMLILVTASVILLIALLSFNVNAQELASATSTATNTTVNAPSNNATMKKQIYHRGPAGNQSSGNYTSPLAFSNNNTLTKAEILKQRGVPGQGINNAPGLKKPFNSLSASSNNSTPTKTEILQQRGVPGKGIDNAPGLKKPFNSKAAENTGIKEFLYRFNHRFQEMIQKYFPLS